MRNSYAWIRIWISAAHSTRLEICSRHIPNPTRSPCLLQIRVKTKQALLQYTDSVIDDLRGQGAEMMRGVDWAAVEAYVDLKRTLNKVVPRSGMGSRASDGLLTDIMPVFSLLLSCFVPSQVLPDAIEGEAETQETPQAEKESQDQLQAQIPRQGSARVGDGGAGGDLVEPLLWADSLRPLAKVGGPGSHLDWFEDDRNPAGIDESASQHCSRHPASIFACRQSPAL